ncbi:helix-turn-helix domain-containing protein [Enterococcus sp. AZ192]|uniref:helix-turn-helix domain-containing protein n=1 Tax=unclassified Enterococcus TaxID=2608891 RepID=UPI003D2C110F
MLYDQIKKLASKKGISIQKIEADLELSNGIISKWNKAKPTINNLAKVADYLGMTVDDLLKKSEQER